MSALAEFQDAFARALVADAPESDMFTVQPGFAVYRNTRMRGCIDALRANFPAVARLVGDAWFVNAAAVYVRREPPCDPRLLFYGSGFPAFLADFPPATELPYLSGVAQLDRFWIESHAAAEDEVADPARLLALATDELGCTIVRPRASTRWQWFEDMPIHSIWRANREGRQAVDPVWQGEGGIVVRNGGHVQSVEIGRAHCAFLDACAAGQPLSGAAQAAVESDADVSVATLITTLLHAGVLRAVHDGT